MISYRDWLCVLRLISNCQIKTVQWSWLLQRGAHASCRTWHLADSRLPSGAQEEHVAPSARQTLKKAPLPAQYTVYEEFTPHQLSLSRLRKIVPEKHHLHTALLNWWGVNSPKHCVLSSEWCFVFCICIYGFSTGLSLNRGSLRQKLMKKKLRRKIKIGNRMMRGGSTLTQCSMTSLLYVEWHQRAHNGW